MTMIDPKMITTALELPGHRVTRSLGVVRGIGVRYDANEITAGVTEVLAYGTGVYVEISRA